MGDGESVFGAGDGVEEAGGALDGLDGGVAGHDLWRTEFFNHEGREVALRAEIDY